MREISFLFRFFVSAPPPKFEKPSKSHSSRKKYHGRSSKKYNSRSSQKYQKSREVDSEDDEKASQVEWKKQLKKLAKSTKKLEKLSEHRFTSTSGTILLFLNIFENASLVFLLAALLPFDGSDQGSDLENQEGLLIVDDGSVDRRMARVTPGTSDLLKDPFIADVIALGVFLRPVKIKNSTRPEPFPGVYVFLRLPFVVVCGVLEDEIQKKFNKNVYEDDIPIPSSRAAREAFEAKTWDLCEGLTLWMGWEKSSMGRHGLQKSYKDCEVVRCPKKKMSGNYCDAHTNQLVAMTADYGVLWVVFFLAETFFSLD